MNDLKKALSQILKWQLNKNSFSFSYMSTYFDIQNYYLVGWGGIMGRNGNI